jgi:hypothetical protein
MFSTTDCDLRYAAHTERVGHIDRTGWQQTTTEAARPRPRLAWVGDLVARAGQWRRATRHSERVTAAPGGQGLS